MFTEVYLEANCPVMSRTEYIKVQPKNFRKTKLQAIQTHLKSGVRQVLAKGKQFLPLITYPPC
jgi:hypothetical protein